MYNHNKMKQNIQYIQFCYHDHVELFALTIKLLTFKS